MIVNRCCTEPHTHNVCSSAYQNSTTTNILYAIVWGGVSGGDGDGGVDGAVVIIFIAPFNVYN